jgi:hypothetical protein
MKLLSTVSLALLPAALAAQQHFTELTSITGPSGAPYGFGLTVRDLDGDGDLDVGTGPWNGSLQVFLNDGEGALDELPGAGPAGGVFTNDMAAGDVDGDGDVDVVLASFQRPMQLYLNDGGASFRDASQTGLGGISGYEAIALGDFDGDGDLDLAIGGTPAESPRILLNDGSGGFASGAIDLPPVGARFQRIRAADLDGDGDLDAIVATTGRDVLLINAGGGVMVDRSDDLPAGPHVTADVALGDVDVDGDLDAVLGHQLPSYAQVLLNDGRARFTRAGDSSVTPRPVSILSLALGDADQDGDLDLAVGTWSDAPLELYLGDGRGRFVNDPGRTPRGGLDATENTAFADLDGDGDPELVLGNQWTANTRNPMRIYTNLHRQVHAPAPPRLGAPYAIDFYSEVGYGSATAVVLPLIGIVPAAIPLGALGVLRVEPASTLVSSLLLLPAPAGHAALALPIPSSPQLVGLPILTQALFASATGAARLSNLASGQVQP